MHARLPKAHVRAECLDWVLITHQHRLERTLAVFVEHYNEHRPHRALGLVPPAPLPSPSTLAPDSAARVHRRDRVGGLLHEYMLAS
jgi:transposase InsO family protein